MTPEKAVTKTLVLKSKHSEMRKASRLILDEVERYGYCGDDVFAIHLSVEEALVNAIKHGNKKAPEKTVTIEYSATGEKFEISVSDEGNGFDLEKVPDPREKDNLHKISGRGVLLMQSYMDIVEYNKSGNRVHMVKYRSK